MTIVARVSGVAVAIAVAMTKSRVCISRCSLIILIYGYCYDHKHPAEGVYRRIFLLCKMDIGTLVNFEKVGDGNYGVQVYVCLVGGLMMA